MSFNPQSGPTSSRKVAIPRLQRTSQGAKQPDRRRVQRACTACRSHKIKCTGDSPQCKHCENTGRECMYIMPRKDRLKTVTERCVQMATLLKRLRGFANEDDSARIGELLDAAEEDIFESQQALAISPSDTIDEDSRGPGTLLDTSMVERLQKLNTESLDLLHENLHENDQSRATGFVGQNSEVQWLRSFLLLERGDNDMAADRDASATSSNNEQVSAVTYYLDNQSIELEFQIDPYELPTTDVAEQLLKVYMEKVHDSFPILPRTLFEDQCRKCFDGLRHGSALRLTTKWQAILNLVFAIGAKYSHLVKTSWQADERDHLVYQARAHAFAWNESTLGRHPDLPQIQVAGLVAFYYLSVGQVSRAWVVVGVALRFATALGLHVRNEDPSASRSKREVLVRVWWSLYHLERQISIMTGRPSVIVDSCCSVPLPAPFSEQQVFDDASLVNALRRSSVPSTVSPTAHSHPFHGPRPMSSSESPRLPLSFGGAEANSGSYFKAVVQLCIISQSILTSLYSAGTTIRSSNELHQDIVQLNQRLDDWVAELPVDLNFHIRRPAMVTEKAHFFRERTLLAFQFFSAKILLTRPCLGGLGKSEKHSKEATASTGFNRRMAGVCVDAAKTEVDLLPDQPHPRIVYEFGPWWTIVHNLMQALAVFLLTLSYSPEVLQDNVVLARYCTKIIRWLRAMDDPLAERAYRVALGCFELVANRLSLPGSLADDQMPSHGLGQDITMQTAHPTDFPMAYDMAYGPSFAATGYAGMPDGSSTFLPYGSSASDGMFCPPINGHVPDENLYHHQSDV